MTTATLPRSTAIQRPGIGRLTKIELRKMTDTRAGFWLVLFVGALTLVVAGISALTRDTVNFVDVLSDTIQTTSVLLPVVGILLVSSEWSQRTALQTFTLVPERGRVLAAKTLAGIGLGLASWLFSIGVSALLTGIAGADSWSLSTDVLAQGALYSVASMGIGLAFGAAILLSAPAIVAYFALPTAFSALASIDAIHDQLRWLDQTDALSPLTNAVLDGTQWGRVATSLLVWMVLPAVIGWVRIRRAEIS